MKMLLILGILIASVDAFSATLDCSFNLDTKKIDIKDTKNVSVSLDANNEEMHTLRYKTPSGKTGELSYGTTVTIGQNSEPTVDVGVFFYSDANLKRKNTPYSDIAIRSIGGLSSINNEEEKIFVAGMGGAISCIKK